MIEESIVNKVLDANAKSGYSEKTKKDWSMSRVELKNGETAFIFNPIEVGDVVEAVQNGEYKNWQKKKVDPKHDEIMKLLREIHSAVTQSPIKSQENKPEWDEYNDPLPPEDSQ